MAEQTQGTKANTPISVGKAFQACTLKGKETFCEIIGEALDDARIPETESMLVQTALEIASYNAEGTNRSHDKKLDLLKKVIGKTSAQGLLDVVKPYMKDPMLPVHYSALRLVQEVGKHPGYAGAALEFAKPYLNDLDWQTRCEAFGVVGAAASHPDQVKPALELAAQGMRDSIYEVCCSALDVAKAIAGSHVEHAAGVALEFARPYLRTDSWRIRCAALRVARDSARHSALANTALDWAQDLANDPDDSVRHGVLQVVDVAMAHPQCMDRAGKIAEFLLEDQNAHIRNGARELHEYYVREKERILAHQEQQGAVATTPAGTTPPAP